MNALCGGEMMMDRRRSLNAAALSSFGRIGARDEASAPTAETKKMVLLPRQSLPRLQSFGLGVRRNGQMGSSHHHFMQWRVISSERRLLRRQWLSSPLLSYPPTKYFLTPESGRKYLATFPFPPSPFDRRRRSPRIPFCSEFCDHRVQSGRGR